MAAPAAGAFPSLPAGAPMPNGFPAAITNSVAPNALVWPTMIQVIGYDNQEPIDIVNYFNILYRTKAPNSLIDIPDISFTADYSSSSFSSLISTIGKPGTITIFFPDNGTVAFYGYYSKFVPEKWEEKKQPKAEVTVVCTNWDPVHCVEAGPVFTVGSTCYSSHG